jgi:hypothetical protein
MGLRVGSKADFLGDANIGARSRFCRVSRPRRIRSGQTGDRPFGFASPDAIATLCTDVKLQDYNFACGSVWVRNLVSDIKGGTTLGVFENRALRRIFGPKNGEKCIMKTFMISTLRQVFLE